MIEHLESRIAPAVLLNASSFSYTDVDGDKVVVKFTKPILTVANFDTLISISGGLAGAGPQELTSLNLADLGPTNNGLGISVKSTAVKNTLGDGRVASLDVNASDVSLSTGVGAGIDLGVVTIDGDVNYIDAGDSDASTLSLKSFTAASVGMRTASIVSEIFGRVEKFTVLGDFAGEINVKSTGFSAPARIDFLKIGGSILGNFGSSAVKIRTDGGIGKIYIGGDIIGGVLDESGSIKSPSGFQSIVVKGSIFGGEGFESGFISGFNIASLTVGGNIVGGSGDSTGVVRAYNGVFGKATVGAIFGGSGKLSGVIQAGGTFNTMSDFGPVVIKRGIFGGDATDGSHGLSGAILAEGNIEKITINGGFIGASIIAGLQPGADGLWGTADDARVLGASEGILGPVTIKGTIAAPRTGEAIRALTFTSLKIASTVIKPGSVFADFAIGFNIGENVLVKAF